MKDNCLAFVDSLIQGVDIIKHPRYSYGSMAVCVVLVVCRKESSFQSCWLNNHLRRLNQRGSYLRVGNRGNFFLLGDLDFGFAAQADFLALVV